MEKRDVYILNPKTEVIVSINICLDPLWLWGSRR